MEQQAINASLAARMSRHSAGVTKRQAEQVAQAAISSQASSFPWYETAVTLAGTGETISTENALTEVTCPNNDDWAYIQFEAKSTSNTDVGTLSFEDYRTGAIVDVSIVDGDEDDAQPRPPYWVPLRDRKFRYKFTSSAGSPDFKVIYIGRPS